MGSTTSRACFLSRVGGEFEGGGERVEVIGFFGLYFLHGSSQQSGVHARARCIAFKPGSEVIIGGPLYRYFPWVNSNSGPKYGYVHYGSLPLTGSMCFIAGISGKFEGGGEYVRTYVGHFLPTDGDAGWHELAASMQPVATRVKAGCVW